MCTSFSFVYSLYIVVCYSELNRNKTELNERGSINLLIFDVTFLLYLHSKRITVKFINMPNEYFNVCLSAVSFLMACQTCLVIVSFFRV